MSSIFNKAKAWKKFEGENPVSQIKTFKVTSARTSFLETKEVKKLINVCAGYLKTIVIIAIHTGMRRGEILGLKWHDIDFKRGIIHLMNTKNGKKREVPMNKAVALALSSAPHHESSEYVFFKKDGSSIADIKKTFSTALKRCGIKSIRFHDLRHTAGSQLVMAGVDLYTVKEILGHSSIEMTMRYAHLSPDHKKQAVDMLAARMGT